MAEPISHSQSADTAASDRLPSALGLAKGGATMESGNEKLITLKESETERGLDEPAAALDLQDSTMYTIEEPSLSTSGKRLATDLPSSSDEEEEIHGDLPDTVGGTIASNAFCLLAGVSVNDNAYSPAQLPITCIPATLGRHHMTDDDHFISMGKLRALSRQMFRIDYRTKDGILVHESNKFSFVKDKTEPKFIDSSLIPSSPDEAFFSVTSLGKNNILVNGKRLAQGQSAKVDSGDAIKVSCYMLYFLLPTQASTQTMQFGAGSPKRKALSSSSTKKRPLTVVSTAMPTIASKKKKTTATAATAPTTNTTSGGGGGGGGSNVGGWLTLQADLNAASTEGLVAQCVQAIDSDLWDRRLGKVGNTVAERAVVACAADPVMQRRDVEQNGVRRDDILEWISNSHVFGEWSRKIQTVVENRTFVTNLSKALINAGYERTANAGRLVRWHLPGTTGLNVKTSTDEAAEPDEEDSGGGDDVQGQNEGSGEEEQSDDDDAPGDNQEEELEDGEGQCASAD